MGNSFKNKIFRRKSSTLNIGLDINILLVTSFAQKHLAQAFKYSIDDNYPIKSTNEDNSYQPVRTYKNIRLDEKQNLELSVSISRRVSIYNTEPYHEFFFENRNFGFNMIVLLYDSSSISPEDFSMSLIHMKKAIDVYNPEKTIAIDFNKIGYISNELMLPKWISMIITKIPHDASNFADKLLDRIFNSDIILSDLSSTTDLQSGADVSILRESTVRAWTS
jgi:hypothetical protein